MGTGTKICPPPTATATGHINQQSSSRSPALSDSLLDAGQLPTPIMAENSPIALGEEVWRPISCHRGRVSGIGRQLLGGPLRIWIVGLDEGDVAHQWGVGRAENLLSHLLWVVRCHLQGRDKRGTSSTSPALTPNPSCYLINPSSLYLLYVSEPQTPNL